VFDGAFALRPALIASLVVSLVPLPALAQQVPAAVGQCVTTTVAEIGSRLDGVPDSGTAIRYGNGIWGVSYDVVAEIARARVGDPVRLCLTAVPEDCPPGDDRGRFYAAEDERTGESWELPDAEHMCGGA